MLNTNVVGSFSVPRTTQSAGTAITWFIPPLLGKQGDGGPIPFTVDTTKTLVCGANSFKGFPNWWGQQSTYTHVTHASLINSSTTHTISILRPLNWTWFTAAVAKNVTAFGAVLFDDPGVYSTNYKYPLPSNQVVSTADAAISSTNKYVMYQLQDGTWQLDTIASGTFGSTLTMTTGTPNHAGGGIIKNSPLFYFGTTTLKDPATAATLGFDTTVSVTQDLLASDHGSLWQNLHRCDPILFYNPNATGADTMAGMWGVYTKDW